MTRAGAALVGGLALAWGANWPAMKLGLEVGLPPLWLAALRFAAGAACLLPLVLWRSELVRPAHADRALLWGGALGPMAGFTALACLALTVLPAGPSAVVAYATPLWVVPLAWVLLGERPGVSARLGAALGLAGLAVISGPWAIDWSDGAQLAGQVALLAAAALWAASILQVRARGGRLATPVAALVLWQLVLATALLLPLALLIEGGPPHAALLSPGGLVALGWIGPIGTALAFWMMLEMNRSMSATAMATATLAVPAAGLLLAWAVLAEQPSFTALLGCALVLAGVALAATAAPRPTTPSMSPVEGAPTCR